MMDSLKGRRVVITADAVGGVWRYALDVAGGLRRVGVDACLLGQGPAPNSAQLGAAAAADVPVDWLDERLDWTATSTAEVKALARDLFERVKALRADLLHLNAPALAGAYGYDGATVVAAHSCLATWWRAMRGTPLPEEWNWHKELTGQGLSRARVSVAPSASFAADLREVYGHLPHLRVVPNAAEPVPPHPREDAVLAAGRWWDEAKNLAVLDAAAEHVRWPVHAAGSRSGPTGPAVHASHLVLLGPVDPAAMAERTARAPIFVSLSLYEPFGLSVLEAATAGAALVLSDIPTFRELWEDAALFVDPLDPVAAADAMNWLIDHPVPRARLGAAAATRARRFSSTRQIDALLRVYAEALQLEPLPA